MVSIPSSCRPGRELRELLQVQQEPFSLQAYLYENGYQRNIVYEDNCTCGCWPGYHHSTKNAAFKNRRTIFGKCSRFLRALLWTIGVESSKAEWGSNGECIRIREAGCSSSMYDMGEGGKTSSSFRFDGELADGSFLGLQHYNVFVFTDDDGAAIRQYTSVTTQTCVITKLDQSKFIWDLKQSSDPALSLEQPLEDRSKRMNALDSKMELASNTNGKWGSEPYQADTKLIYDEVQTICGIQGDDHVTSLTQYFERDLSTNSEDPGRLGSEPQRLEDIAAKVADAIFESACHGFICEMLDSIAGGSATLI